MYRISLPTTGLLLYYLLLGCIYKLQGALYLSSNHLGYYYTINYQDAFTNYKEHCISLPTTWVIACAYSPNGQVYYFKLVF